MSVAQLSVSSSNQFITDGSDFTPAARWDGYASTMSVAFADGYYEGNNTNWNGTSLSTTVNLIQNIQYSGYNTNWGQIQSNVVVLFQNSPYAGYSTNWGKTNELDGYASVNNVDINSVIDHPKDQTFYFKLKGYNPNTNTYETWIITEDITSRPELFDPGRHPPNFENGVYFTPPSGNPLVNIAIVARWIQ